MDISNLSAYQGLLSSQISNQKTNELKGVLNNAAEKTDDELMDACKEFEAYFLEQVFKGMEKTVVKADNSSSSMDTMVDFYKDELYKKLAKTSTETNSIGLAKQMYEQMKRNYSVKPATDETESI
ncbi:MAG: rod-binding protein [Lachnospiraceae bacterium]|nr:rod-binding protein [Lachnospiraceae bacterium]MBR4994233.1 rod-binding protein [Lachnospiraceae bacterium]MBR5944491.1 rod-binding protein [Lachnospiraceae bacterium]